jgi:hypothetical protein
MLKVTTFAMYSRNNFLGNVNSALKYVHYSTYDLVSVRAGIQ